jgi:hypothetical protein
MARENIEFILADLMTGFLKLKLFDEFSWNKKNSLFL